MGKAWDGSKIAFDVALWREVLRVLKPGGHLLSFGGTRTYHRMTCAIEDAGFEIRDCITWHYGSGFPKSLDVSKAIDKAAGAEREVVGSRRLTGTARIIGGQGGATSGRSAEMYATHETRDTLCITAPATDAARQWSGWGTALKPSTEPIVVARKPLGGTVAANVQAFGTGAINVDGCRVGSDVVKTRHTSFGGGDGWEKNAATGESSAHVGRWPPNLLLTHSADCGEACADDCPVAMMDRQSGETKSGNPASPIRRPTGFGANFSDDAWKPDALSAGVRRGDSGGASRFFPTFDAEPFLYQSKASKRDRGAGNTHPTVKPTALMRWLVRLVTPPGGLVLDPFAGSGTTLVAAQAEGFRAVGIEREAEHVAIIRGRVQG